MNNQTQELNDVARQKLSDMITEQMKFVETAITWEIKIGLDEMEFARIRALTDPMDEVENHIELAAKRLNYSFERYADNLRKLLAVTATIKGSER